MGRRAGMVLITIALAMGGAHGQEPPEPGLLFYLSGDRGLTADYAAGGDPRPNFASDVRIVQDGARGAAIECGHTQLLSYRAAGRVFAERGTLSFYWRAREPVGPTPFPVFRVGYADHSSWDMTWLRIDYNGTPGFDAFVTDASLARTRVSHTIQPFPGPREWTHLALSWDETRGIRFYVNGALVAHHEGTAVLAAALDQFGPHSRTIGPMQVQSAYNFVRGGDIDELRIYDRMLSDDNIAALARGERPGPLPEPTRALDVEAWRSEWWTRYGWDRADDPPPALAPGNVRIRKVEISDAYDVKRWWWKGTDGIRETTWPGVYNRSRLPGRNDYFQLPDWDCYSISGRQVTFMLPDEPWNQIEVSGAAWGTFGLVDAVTSDGDGPERHLFDRPKGRERTVHRLDAAERGGRLRFTNAEQETPIGELAAYSVTGGDEPSGSTVLRYRITALAAPDQPSVATAMAFIAGRFPADERSTVVALPAGAPSTPRPPAPGRQLPLVHVLVPSDFRYAEAPRPGFSYTWANMAGGLDGIALDVPALGPPATHGGLIPLNIQVKDPIWPLRALLDVSVSVKPGEPHTLWLDTRDRILPNDLGLYLTIASASPTFGASSLEGMGLRLIFKPAGEAAREHVQDRFTQVRDNFANIIEERPNTRRLDLFRRFEADLSDLLRVDPDHARGREYWYEANREQPRPAVALAPAPAGVPLWATRQVQLFGYVKRLVNWYIDHRQIENGEFGGGLSDDGDLTNWWPGTALMGATPGKITRSLLKEMDAFYAEGMFTNGLSTIQTDELHSYEEGIQVLGQSMLLDYGSPTQLERAMDTARALERLTGINAAGHRHIRSSYFSGTTVAEEGVWGWSKPSSYLALHPAISLVDFNGAPKARAWLLELADSLLAHTRPAEGGVLGVRATVEFATDRDRPQVSERAAPLLWAAFRWTGDRKYIQPFLDAGVSSLPLISGNALDLMGVREAWAPQLAGATGAGDINARRHLAWQVTGDTKWLEALYTDQAESAAVREYINTEGSIWIDRVAIADAELQRARLGGIAIVRNATYPGHVVSWQFAPAGADERVAILVPEATRDRIRIVAYNTDTTPVTATMTAWDVEPGRWTVAQATGEGLTRIPEGAAAGPAVDLERSAGIPVTFAPRTTTVVEMRLVSKGTPYWRRPDLGISREDVATNGATIRVTMHSLGAEAAPSATLVLRDRSGRVLGRVATPALPAPLDLRPRRAHVVLRAPAGADLTGGSLAIESAGPEVTQRNNVVRF